MMTKWNYKDYNKTIRNYKHSMTQHDTALKAQQTLTQQKKDVEGRLRMVNRSNKELRHRTLAADNRHHELKGQCLG